MKYSNWSRDFANNPNSDSYKKNAVDVANLTIHTISAKKCIKKIKKDEQQPIITNHDMFDDEIQSLYEAHHSPILTSSSIRIKH